VFRHDQLEQLVASLTEGVLLVEPDQTIGWANQAALEMHGVETVAELGRTVTEYRRRFRLRYRNNHLLLEGRYPIERVLSGETFADVVVEVFTPGADTPNWVHRVRSLVLTAPDGTPDCLLLVLRDASDWANAEERFERAFAANPAPAVICRLSDRRFIKVNRGFLEMTGLEADEVLDSTLYELDVLEASPDRDAAVRRIARFETIPQTEATVRLGGRAGGRKPVVVAGQPIEVGPERCMLFTFVDLDAHKRIERTLRTSEERFARAFSMLPVPAALLEGDASALLEVNDAFAAQMGDLADAPERMAALRKEVRRVLASGTVRNAPFRVERADGSLRDCVVSVERVAVGEREALLLAWLDITDRKRAELDLVRAVELAMQDSSWFGRSLVEKLESMRGRVETRETPRIEDLTAREREVFDRLCEGLADKEVARALAISPATVRNHVASIYTKLRVRSRTGLILWSRSQGLDR
jgi:PAS domain S-box-containing protein